MGGKQATGEPSASAAAQQIHHVAALRTSSGRMAPSAGRLQGHLLLLRSLQFPLLSTKIAATVVSDSQLAFFPGNTSRTPQARSARSKFDGACRPAMAEQGQAGVPCYVRYSLSDHRPPMGLFKLQL
jgi:hypothetical protein